MGVEHFDVLIVGAGISGVGAACKLAKKCPQKSYAVLEARSEIGGTWDLFRYPGIRSDSDMYTLGYGFRPWRDAKAIADGPSIKAYVAETAKEAGVNRKIRFNHRVREASWSSADARWTVMAETPGGPVRFTCSFLMMCSGYYRYAEGYAPAFKGRDRFKGRIVHPQHWPEDLDYDGKRVIVIGSGATAVTLIPAMTDRARHVIMLQRSPSYIFSMPAESPLAKFLAAILPKRVAFFIMRWHRIIFTQIMFKMARARPRKTRERLIALAQKALPDGYDVARHFTPKYNPWDQRLCLVPDDDLFAAIRSGKASVETDEIETFTESGVRLKSGKELAADIIVTATGLALEVLGGAKLSIDGRAFKSGEAFTYRGFGFSGVPNLAAVFGYTNASWTLRADLVADYVCRLINHMDRNGYISATPVVRDPAMKPEPFLDFSSGYVRRSIEFLPKQGSGPWRHPQDYASDIVNLRFGRIEDGVLQFARPAAAAGPAAKVLAAAE